MKLSVLGTLLLTIMILLSACGGTPAEVIYDNPMPPPAGAQYTMIHMVSDTSGNESQDIVFPGLTVKYGESGDSKNIGGVAAERIFLDGLNIAASMDEYNWGTIAKSQISMVQYYDSNGNVLVGLIQMQIPNASVFQWLAGDANRTFDRGDLILLYLAPETGAWPHLKRIYYVEQWGLNKDRVLNFGQQAVWLNDQGLLPQLSSWGFWENQIHQYQFVKNSLDEAARALKGITPELRVVDKDSVRDFFGRQSGQDVYLRGEKWLEIDYSFKKVGNLVGQLGTMPNTPNFGAGALSRITWQFVDGRCYAESVLSAFSIPPSAIYVFTDDCSVADKIDRMNRDQWAPTLYQAVRNEAMPGVLFLVHSGGNIKALTGLVTTSEGSGTAKIGEGGGLSHRTLGNPSFEDVSLVYDLLSLIGKPGLKAIKHYYGTQPNLGNDLPYYLSILRIATAPEETVLDVFGQDISLLDTFGIPRWEQFEQ